MSSAIARKRVIIVGGGFAGLGCAHRLAERADIDVTLIDRNNYHQFQPMLYQVATSQLPPVDVAYSLRKLFLNSPQVDVMLAEIQSVDPAAMSVVAATGEKLQGDYLVLAAGSQVNFFNVPGAKAHAFPLYSLDDANRLRSRILQIFEDADRDPALVEEGALDFVVVGAGPTGVELAGALADLIRRTMSVEYPKLPTSSSRIYLIDHGKHVLNAFSDETHTYAAKVLKDLGVEIRLGIAVKEVDAGHVLLSDGTTIKTRLVVWAGGLKASAMVDSSGLPTGHGGRINVEADLTVNGFSRIYVPGDLANIPDGKGGTLPQLGSVALQAGRWAGDNIIADIAGKPRLPFDYEDKGIMAMINRDAAVAELGPHRHEMHGHLALIAWIGVHTYLMSGTRNRINAIVNWAWDRFSSTRGPQLLDHTVTTPIDWAKDSEGGQ